MSEQAPEQPSSSAARPPGPPGSPPGRENVFTRKIGPLPMWVWLVIAAALILLYIVWKGRSSSQQTGQQQQGLGAALIPDVIYQRFITNNNVPPHQRHRHHRGGHDHDDHDHDDDHDHEEAAALESDRQAAARDPGAGVHHIPGHNRRHLRMGPPGEPVPGELTTFKTADHGQTPSLADVANRYNTDPEAIVMEAEGRGYPHSGQWRRYVAAHNWANPLPPATELSILAHPNG